MAVPVVLAAVAAGAVAAGLRLAVDRRMDARWARGERLVALAVAGFVIAALVGRIAAVGDPFDVSTASGPNRPERAATTSASRWISSRRTRSRA